jgi:hypothetical protein
MVQPVTPTFKVVWSHRHSHNPVGKWDVYMDDFIGLSQGSATRRKHIKRALLHILDLVFRILNDTDGPHRQEPASIKKLLKGDATWATRNRVLGSVIDTVNKTVHLSIHRVERLHTILASIPVTQRLTSTKQWQQVIVELCSMALEFPGVLFCSLQEALRHTDNYGTRVRLGRHVHVFLEDFRWLAKGLVTRPTSMLEVTPSASPATRGACDAYGKDMGGVYFVPDTDGTIQAHVWRYPPLKVTRKLITTANPTGKINNGDLELAGSVAHHDILIQLANLQDITIHNCYKNTSTVFWQRKGSATITGPALYLL